MTRVESASIWFYGGAAVLVPLSFLLQQARGGWGETLFAYAVVPTSALCVVMALTRAATWTRPHAELLAAALWFTLLVGESLSPALFYLANLVGRVVIDAWALLAVAAAGSFALLAILGLADRWRASSRLSIRLLYSAATSLFALHLLRIGGRLYLSTRETHSRGVVGMWHDLLERLVVCVVLGASLALAAWLSRARSTEVHGS